MALRILHETALWAAFVAIVGLPMYFDFLAGLGAGLLGVVWMMMVARRAHSEDV